MRKRFAVLAALAALALPASSAASGDWYDSLDIGNLIETKGFWNGHRIVKVDYAGCYGLRRFGVTGNSLEERFHRFKCSVEGADGHFYDVRVRPAPTPGKLYIVGRKLY